MKPPEIRVDVEPLGEARWEKIGQGVFEQLDQSESVRVPPAPKPANAWRGPALLVVAGALAACIGGFAARTLWHSEPTVVAPSQVTTGASGTHLTFGEAALDVGAQSALLVSGDDARGVLLVLEHGRVECEVAPRLERPPFVVQAGDVRVRVVGTHFAVERTDGGARVEVSKGAVEVTAHGEVRVVRAGERWPVDAALSSTASPDSLVLPAVKPPSHVFSPPVSIPPPRRGPGPGPGHTDDVPPSFPAPGVTPAPGPPPTDRAPPSVSANIPSLSESPGALYEAAARLESTDPAAALARYRALARGRGPWAANALYAAGRLEADRGARDQARRTLEDYLARFPQGANAADARDLLNRLRPGTAVP